ncbi:TM2 domain-containing protein [Winogradskyella ursingii]|uniref:TM2 domain-containing protein n=1 Tax=Winogradskyella ursingii TaxID=2686079 RepID=UPI0015CCE4DE|nr:TM2 domain-containing protein [Winogradskyella ursingii]
MSDDNKNLGDDLNDMLDDAKDNAKQTGDKISQSAKEFSADAKEKAQEFSKEAKSSAKEFSDGAKEAFGGPTGENKKLLAGIVAIIFGGLGIHKFILGYNKEGGILLGLWIIGAILTCVGVGVLLIWALGLIGLIEGIIYLTKSDEEFYRTYQLGRKPWF